MSIRANPKAIGLFMIGAVVLTVIGVATLASTTWFDKQTTFISYFGESVNGLEVGASVKFRGVPVGHVTDLLIQIHSSLEDKTFKTPVRYEIDLDRLTSETGGFVHLDDPGVLRQQIDNGLRATLQMESIVTGQLYIELSYLPDAPIAQVMHEEDGFLEIPTNPSLLAAFGTEAGSIVAGTLKILNRTNEMLDQMDVAALNASLVQTAQAFEALAESEEIREALEQVPLMSAQFNQTMAEMEGLVEKLGGTIDPLQQQLAGTNAEVVLTLQTVRQSLEETQGFLSTDSGVGYQMGEAFSSMKEAADALSTLAVSLERNPTMLITGKNTPK